ncbi:MAG: hypothetical protein GTN76_08915 [Candidatus Aenigmarchaeota archaeon]|nr:hypothetical protein [Candidatus Aenigmarchaeota archaeon]
MFKLDEVFCIPGYDEIQGMNQVEIETHLKEHEDMLDRIAGTSLDMDYLYLKGKIGKALASGNVETMRDSLVRTSRGMHTILPEIGFVEE